MLWTKTRKKPELSPDLQVASRRVQQLSDRELHRWVENLLADIGRETAYFFDHPDLPDARDHLAWAKNHLALLQLFLDDAEDRAQED